MKLTILSLRLNRRAIGAAALADDALTMIDERHLLSSRDRVVPNAVRYVERLLEQSQANAVVVDAPATVEGSATRQVLNGILATLSSRGFVPLLAGKADILTAYGVTPVRSRAEVRSIVSRFWPQLPRTSGEKIKPYPADAAAAALFAQCRVSLSPPPT